MFWFVRTKQADLILILCFSLLMTGCNCQDPPIVDELPSNLDVKFTVLDIDDTPSDGKVLVVAQFMQNGKVVQLASNTTIACNGKSLTYNGLLFGYAERVPRIAPEGFDYLFRHTRNGVITNVTFPVPVRPVFSAPTIAGATLTRSNNFTIHYVAGSGTSVRGSASQGSNSVNNSQPDDGTHNGLDVSGFSAGAGRLGITRTHEDPLSGTGFHSASRVFEANKTISITWQ